MSYVNAFGVVVETDEDELRETRAPMTLIAWCRAAYENSKAHGWHDHPDDGKPARMPIRMADIHAEVSELLEAFKVGNPHAPCDKPGLVLSRAAEEMADITIRLFDFVVEFKLDPSQVFDDATFPSIVRHAKLYEYHPQDLGEEICGMHQVISRMQQYTFDSCALLLMKVAAFAVRHGIDLELAVKTKHAYNVTRPHMHGGKNF